MAKKIDFKYSETKVFYRRKKYDGGYILGGMGLIALAVFATIETFYYADLANTGIIVTRPLFSMIVALIMGMVGVVLVGVSLNEPEEEKVYLETEEA
jgi:hypothetical protein